MSTRKHKGRISAKHARMMLTLLREIDDNLRARRAPMSVELGHESRIASLLDVLADVEGAPEEPESLDEIEMQEED